MCKEIDDRPLYEILMERVKENNKRLYETVGQPAPYTITIYNKAEYGVGFEPKEKPPKPPKNRLWCDVCGDITETGLHTNWMCKLINWINNK